MLRYIHYTKALDPVPVPHGFGYFNLGLDSVDSKEKNQIPQEMKVKHYKVEV